MIDCLLPLHQLLCAFFCKSTDSLLALACLVCFFTGLVSVLNLFILHSVLDFKANGLAQTSASKTLFRGFLPMTSDFRHSLASEEEWAALEPVLEDGFSAFFFRLGFLIIFPNGVYETSSSIRLRGVEIVHFRVKF